MKKTRTPLAEVESALQKRFKGKIKLVGPYSGAHKSALFKCVDCGNEQTSTFFEKLKAKYGCRGCANKAAKTYSHDQFLEVFSKKPGSERFHILGKYKNSGSPIKVQCASCAHIWEPKAGNLLNTENGCPQCAKFNTVRYDFKTKKLGSRKVRVQGYEPQAIDWLLSDRGVRPEDIEVFADRKVPEIPYKWRGRNRVYRPDLMVGKTLYEVKSVWTLLDAFDVNKAKAKAAEDAGYVHKVLLCNTTDVVCLPPDWAKKKAQFIGKWFRRKTARPLTVLALDPGVTNFGWSVVQTTGAHKFSVVATGMLHNTVSALNGDLQSQVASFISELDNLLATYEPDALAVERFMARGMKGTTIELVNIMIGVVLSHAILHKRRKFLLIPASQWKNELNRNSSLDEFYAAAPKCTPHQMDATGIGLYGAYFWFDVKPFEGFEKLRVKLAKEAMAVNLEADETKKPKKGKVK